MEFYLLWLFFQDLYIRKQDKVPFLPNSLVAVTSASPVLFASPFNQSMQALFAAVTLFIFGREILCDLDDCNCDLGYKWTLPLAIGKKSAKFDAGLIVLFIPFIVLSISDYALMGVPFLLLAALYLINDKCHQTARIWLDIGMVTIVLVLLVSGT